jgi:hypothetical protein
VVVALMKQLVTYFFEYDVFSSLWRAIANWLEISDAFSIDV